LVVGFGHAGIASVSLVLSGSGLSVCERGPGSGRHRTARGWLAGRRARTVSPVESSRDATGFPAAVIES